MHRATMPHRLDTGIATTPINPVIQKARTKMRCLLALDAAALSPKVISMAEAKCVNGADRIDILLVNSPRAPEAVLHRLLISLEGMEVDYKITTGDGELGSHIAQYLRRHKGINQIMVTTLPSLGTGWEVKVSDLRYQGFRFCTLMGLKDE